MALFNTVPGDWAAGERGLAALPGREQEFREGVDKAIVYAKAAKCPLLHTMAGLWPDGRDKAEGERVYLDNLRYAADRVRHGGAHRRYRADQHPRHPRLFPELHRPGDADYRTGRPAQSEIAVRFLSRADHGGRSATKIRTLAVHYPHVQIAGTPGRHEPDIGEINYPFLFDLFDEIGYQGWIGCEYRPKGDTVAGLGWATRYGIG